MHCNSRQPDAAQTLSPFIFVARAKFELAQPISCRIRERFTAYTYVVLRHGQTLYEIWAKSDNPWQSYCTLNIWPYDFEHVSRVALCSGIVCTKFKLGQAMSSWNVTIFGVNTPYHAMTLTFDPLTLNFCGRSCIIWSIYVPHLSEIDQSAAEILMINDRFFVRV